MGERRGRGTRSGEARIRHEAVGLNFADTYFRTGLYPAQLPPASAWPRPAWWRPSVTG